MKRFLSGALLALALLSAGSAHAVSMLPFSGTQQFDVATSPPAYLNGGRLFVYDVGTTTPKTVYSDIGLTTPHASPIVLNAAGRIPAIYAADGTSARIRIENSVSVLQHDEDGVPFVVAPVSSTPTVITAAQLWTTGDVKVRYDDQPADGFVRCNGRTIGSATSGAAERANSDTESLFKLLWAFANITLPAGKGASAAADWSANKQLTLPDCAGRLLASRDDLGNGAQNRITAATVTGPTVIGATGGAQTVTIAQGNLPNVNFTVSGITLTDPGHLHTYSLASSNLQAAVAAGTGFFNVSTAGTNTSSNTTGITIATQGAAASGGAGTALTNMPPVILLTTYIKL